MTFTFTTQAQVRLAFWLGWHGCSVPKRIKGEWPVDVRCEFVDFVDMLNKDSHISDELAHRVTL